MFCLEDKMKKSTSLSIFLKILIIPMLIVTIFVVTVDPFFHYHKPICNLSYVLSEERYQNDGIVKHFDYEAIISGSSVTQNFKASEFEELFEVKTVKTCFAGGTFYEVNELINTALSTHPDTKYVLRSLDLNRINTDKNELGYTDYPTYLYDKNPINDYQYIFNKEVVLNSAYDLLRTIQGKKATSFDEYSNFVKNKTWGKESVIQNSPRLEIMDIEEQVLTEEDYTRIKENLDQNVINLAKEYPDTTFYYFFPPYSAYYWDGVIRTKSLEYVLLEEEYAMELLLEVPNIKLYSFNDQIDITGNPDNYMDSLHYSEEINSYMLQAIHEDEGLITKDNYKEEIERERQIYSDFDYETLY